MKRSLRMLSLVMLILAIAWSAPALEPLTILHTNDIHAHISSEEGRGGLAAICNYMKRVRADQRNVLILDAGDMITGTPVSTMYSGTPVFEIYNTMPYQVAVLGNHEFDHGWSQIAEFLRIARFPILSANIRRPDGALLADAAVQGIAVGNLKVGIIGLTQPNLRALTVRRGWEGLRIEDPVAAARHHLAAFEGRADLIIALTHLGVDEDAALAQAVPELDVIIGGHSHSELSEPRRVGDTLIVQAGCYGRWVGRLDLKVDLPQKRIIEYEGRLIPVVPGEMGSDEATAAAVEKWESRVRDQVDVKIGDNAKSKSRSEMSEIVSEVLKVTYGTDFGYQNPGGTRAGLSAGPISKRDIWTILPFGNTVVIVNLEREQLSAFDASPPEGDFKEFYSVATNSYVAEQVTERIGLGEERLRREPKLVRDVIIEYVEARGSLEKPEPVPVSVPR